MNIDILLGGFIAIASSALLSFLNHRWTMQKEQKQWRRQQTLELNKLSREEHKQHRQQLIDTYNNALFYLSKYITEPSPFYFESEEVNTREYEEKEAEVGKKKNEHFLEAQRYLWLIYINLKGINEADWETFEAAFKTFIAKRGTGAKDLQEILIKLAIDDQRLQPRELSAQIEDLLNP